MSASTNSRTPSAVAQGGAPDSASYAANIYDEEGEWLDEEDDDDDMDFEDSNGHEESEEYFEATDDDDGDTEYQDADDGLSGVEIEYPVNSGGNTIEEPDSVQRELEHELAAGAQAPVQVSRNQILQLLGHAGLRRIFASHGGARLALGDLDEHDDDEDDDGRMENSTVTLLGRNRRRCNKMKKVDFPKVPSDVGRVLMSSGNFGSNEYYQDILRKRKRKLGRRLMNRELGLDAVQDKTANRLVSQGMIPESKADTIIHYNARCYSGQFSDDGNFFFSCAQDFKVRMYDTSNPYQWKYYKTVLYPFGQWTITDASLSPDNKYLAYSSIQSTVCLAPTDPIENGEPWLLDFADMGHGGNHRGHRGYSHFGIWSIRFSGDGREIVAGTGNNSVYVYDLESRRSILRIPGHTEDVNAVCYGDQSSPHILYSGSDDSLLKVWDRRSMGDSREAGVFVGHTEGLTYVDSKGDGRYVLSNGKDQTMKLWDLRKMMSTAEASKINHSRYASGFDYRFMNYSDSQYRAHPNDCSLVTYRGHRVLKTLIRCHFSPPGSTDSRYVYSGSADGSVYIYNIDATVMGKVDVNKATQNSQRRVPNSHTGAYDYDMDDVRQGNWKTCVRDASWHPNAPVIAATSWSGYQESAGTCTIHSWNDGVEDDEAEPKMGQRVDQQLRGNDILYGDAATDVRTAGNSLRSRLRRRNIAPVTNDDEAEGHGR